MPPISLLIKPSSSKCNLKCKYCFYNDIAEKRENNSFGFMNYETLEIIVKKALLYADGLCTFAFQGGEPTLIGLNFYRKLVEFESKYNIKKVKINNVIQTNGIIIDEEWAKFLYENKFLVGLSIDGPKDINDYCRVYNDGKGSYNRIMKTIKYLNKFNVEYNVLFVVTNATARHANKIYNFCKKNNFKHLQFMPCLDPLGEQPGKYEYSLLPNRYVQFLKTIFDLWYRDIKNRDYVSIRFFDNLLDIAAGAQAEMCGMNGRCSVGTVVESDGGVYPCDFYVTDEWYMGNLKETEINELLTSESAKKFVASSVYIDPECRKCKWGALCRGGCRRNREPFEQNNPSKNYYCESYKEFYEFAGDRIFDLAKLLRNI